MDIQEMIFPLGLKQRDMALRALRPVIRRQISDANVIYAYMQGKKAYIENDNNLESAWEYLTLRGQFTGPEKAKIIMYIVRDTDAQSLDELEDVHIPLN